MSRNKRYWSMPCSSGTEINNNTHAYCVCVLLINNNQHGIICTEANGRLIHPLLLWIVAPLVHSPARFRFIYHPPCPQRWPSLWVLFFICRPSKKKSPLNSQGVLFIFVIPLPQFLFRAAAESRLCCFWFGPDAAGIQNAPSASGNRHT